MIHNNVDKENIEKCLMEIEKKISANASIPLGRKDFIFLSDDIFAKTNVLISISTLRRIWSNEYTTTPQKSTLDGLAAYLDFKDWNDYKKYNAEKENSDGNEEQKKKEKFPKFLVGGVSVCCILGLLLYFLPNFNVDAEFFVYKIDSTSFPNVVNFRYLCAEMEEGELKISPLGDLSKTINLPYNDGRIAHVYFLPGCYTPKLMGNDKELASTALCLYSNGWLGYAPRTLLTDFAAGVYFNKEEIFNNNALHIKPETINSKKLYFHTNLRNLLFFLVQDFEDVYCTDFTFECKIKNDYLQDGFHCQRVNLGLIWQGGEIEIPLAQEGYSRHFQLKIGNEIQYGSDVDLSYLEMDLSEWHNVKIQSKDKKLTLLVNGEKIKDYEMDTPRSPLKGIKFVFHGCASAKEIRLLNHKQKVVYMSDF